MKHTGKASDDFCANWLLIKPFLVTLCYDEEQVKQDNLLNHIKALVQIGPMITMAQGLQGLSIPKSLLTWGT